MKSSAIKKACSLSQCNKRGVADLRLFIDTANQTFFVPAFLPAAVKGVCGIFYA